MTIEEFLNAEEPAAPDAPEKIAKFQPYFSAAEQQYGLPYGLFTAIAKQENVNPKHNNPLGLSDASGPKTFSEQDAPKAIFRQAALVSDPNGPYKDFARTGNIDALARVWAPVGAANDPNRTNVTEAAGIKKNLPTYDSIENFLGLGPAKPGVSVGTVTDAQGNVVGLPGKAVPQPASNLPPEEQGLKNIIEKNLATGAKAGVYPKAQRATAADELAQTQAEQPPIPQESAGLGPAAQGAMDVVKGLPGALLQIPKMSWEGLKFAVGDPHERVQIAARAVAEAIPQGQQIASDVQHPFGTRENTRGLIQLAQFGLPLLDFLPKAKIPVEVSDILEKPPVQPPPVPVEFDKRFTMVEPPPEAAPELAAAPPIEQTLPKTAPPLISPETGEGFYPPEQPTAEPLPVKTETARVGFPKTEQEVQAWLDEPAAQPETSVSGPSTQVGQPAGIAESPEATTPGDIASGQQPAAPERAASVGAPEIAGQRLVTGEPVGISQARTEAELGAGSVQPGTGAELGSGLDFGRNYINQGGDPRLPVRRALASGLVGSNEVGIVHAELERLRMERNKALAVASDHPNDIAAQNAFNAADTAQRAWRKELQPVLTASSNALREAYAQSGAHDVGSYAGLSNLVDEHFGGGVVPTPEQRTALRKLARGVQDTRSGLKDSVNKVRTEARKGFSGRIMSPEELHTDLQNLLADAFKDCAT